MKISLNLLKEFLTFESDSLDKDLTMLVHEAESIKTFKNSNIVIGEIKKLIKHLKADRLKYCKVDIGKEILNIACGANNHKVYGRVAVAKPW